MKNVYGIITIFCLGCYFPCSAQFSSFDSLNQLFKERSRWEKDLKNICESAFRYRNTGRSFGGGHGSYVGYILPKNYDSTEFGIYSISDVFPEKIIVKASLTFNKFALLCVVDSNGNCNTRMRDIDYEVNKLGALAYQYRLRPASDGGGQGSYIGFKIPAGNEWTAFGHYTITKVNPNEITIQGNSSAEKFSLNTVFLADGKRQSMVDYYIDLKKIESLAYQYRNLPSSQGGGQGSYVGFKIPHDLDSTSHGKYWLGDVQPDEMVIKVQPPGFQTNFLEVIDSTGKRKLPEYRQRANGEDFIKNDQAMIADVKVISKEAANYWRRSKPTEAISGSFEGFMIPLSIAFTKNGTYSVAEVKEDTLYIKAVSSIGSGFRYFMIDNNGTQIALISGQYHPLVSQLKNSAQADPLTMYKKADWKLNEVYQQLLDKKRSEKRFIKNIHEAERLWIKYRDARLIEKYPAVKPASDKSMFTKPQLIYLTLLTEDRIKEIQELLDQP